MGWSPWCPLNIKYMVLEAIFLIIFMENSTAIIIMDSSLTAGRKSIGIFKAHAIG